MTALLLARGRAAALLAGAGRHLIALPLRHPALWHLRLVLEEELLHLLAQQLARIRIGQIQPVVIDDQARLFLPHLPGLLRDMVVDALAQLTGERRLLQPRQPALELGAHHCSRDLTSRRLSHRWMLLSLFKPPLFATCFAPMT